jgi:hypothetical protein
MLVDVQVRCGRSMSEAKEWVVVQIVTSPFPCERTCRCVLMYKDKYNIFLQAS